MITEDQYKEALRIVEEYKYQNPLEYEPDDDDFEDDDEECMDCGRVNCVCDLANDCHCGAWVHNSQGILVHVADCCC